MKSGANIFPEFLHADVHPPAPFGERVRHPHRPPTLRTRNHQRLKPGPGRK